MQWNNKGDDLDCFWFGFRFLGIEKFVLGDFKELKQKE